MGCYYAHTNMVEVRNDGATEHWPGLGVDDVQSVRETARQFEIKNATAT